MDDHGWMTFGPRGRPVLAQDVGQTLRTYGVKASRMSFNGVILKGFRRNVLEPVWERYLDPYVAGEIEEVEVIPTSEVSLDDLL